MRQFSLVYSQFWTNPEVKTLDDQETILLFYLLTTPHSNSLGLFNLPIYYIQGDLEWPQDKIITARSELIRRGFITLSSDGNWYCIKRFLAFNPPAGVNHVKNLLDLLNSTPSLELDARETFSLLSEKTAHMDLPEPLQQAINTQKRKFKPPSQASGKGIETPSKGMKSVEKPPSEAMGKGLETPGEPYRITETDTETNTDRETERKTKTETETERVSNDTCRADAQPGPREDVSVVKPSRPLEGDLLSAEAERTTETDTEPVSEIFGYWQQVMNHPQARLDDKRKRSIRKALKMGYSVNDLKSAILGCSLTPHNIGINDRNQRYDGLHVILREADQIDRFIGNAKSPPLQNRKTVQDQLNQASINEWAEKKRIELAAREQNPEGTSHAKH